MSSTWAVSTSATVQLKYVSIKLGQYSLFRSIPPFKSAASFGNWFAQCCRDAGLPKGTAAHGFRKAACRRLAEAGCSASEIMAVSGHKSLSEVQRYCAAADQARMARAAQAKSRNAFRIETETSSGKP